MPDPIVYPDGIWCLQVSDGALVCLPMPEAAGVLTFFSSARAELMAGRIKTPAGLPVPCRLELNQFLTWLDQADADVRYVAVDYVLGEPTCKRISREEFRGRLLSQGTSGVSPPAFED
jgi:hypothetical protein